MSVTICADGDFKEQVSSLTHTAAGRCGQKLTLPCFPSLLLCSALLLGRLLPALVNSPSRPTSSSDTSPERRPRPSRRALFTPSAWTETGQRSSTSSLVRSRTSAPETRRVRTDRGLLSACVVGPPLIWCCLLALPRCLLAVFIETEGFFNLILAVVLAVHPLTSPEFASLYPQLLLAATASQDRKRAQYQV